jgi:aspartyl-tRNA(Asn)/glutamyl-tRNA(Gln) amidotransferase subunit C
MRNKEFMTEEQILHYAKMARISLTSKETKALTDEINRMIMSFEKLQDLVTDFPVPEERTGLRFEALREDKTEKRFHREALLKSTPSVENHSVKVPSALE